MKQRTFSILLILFFAFGVSAQTDEARKIDEFENTNCDDYPARIDNLLAELKESNEAKGYVFIYEGKLKQLVYDKNARYKGIKYVSSQSGLVEDLIKYLKEHPSFRWKTSERIAFIEAGFREKFSVELWIVPKEANPPKPAPTLKHIKQKRRKHNPYSFCGEF